MSGVSKRTIGQLVRCTQCGEEKPWQVGIFKGTHGKPRQPCVPCDTARRAQNADQNRSRERAAGQRRVAQRRPTISLDAHDLVVPSAPFEHTLLEADHIAALLQRLSPSHMRILQLRFVAGYSLHETAHLLGLTLGATKALQHRALTHLRKEYTHA